MIYIVCSCDIWKTTDSMRIITATTSVTKLKQLIAQLIEVEAAIKRNYVPPTE